MHVKEFSLDEMVQEAIDVVDIAVAVLQNDADVALALTNLKQAQNYLEHIRTKAKIAVEYVPCDVQEKEHL